MSTQGNNNPTGSDLEKRVHSLENDQKKLYLFCSVVALLMLADVAYNWLWR